MESGFKYNAFISYAQAEDAGLAPELQTALQRIGMPWHRLSKAKTAIFRDASSIKYDGDLTEAIREGLRNSRKLILLCSEKSQASPWVNKEVAYFKELCRERKTDVAKHLLIVVTQGNIKWDDERKDWDRSITNVLPEGLYNCYKDVPLWVDVKDIKKDKNLDTKSSLFRSNVVRIAAFLRDVEPAEIDSIELRAKRTQRRIYTAVILLLLVLLGISTISTIKEKRASTLAEDRRKIAEEASAKERVARLLADSARVQEEQSRLLAEARKKTADSARAQAEEARIIADFAREQESKARIVADSARVQEKQSRLLAEARKKTADSARAQAEEAQMNTQKLNKVLEAENIALTTLLLKDPREKIARSTQAHQLYYRNYDSLSPLHLAKRQTIYQALYDAYLAATAQKPASDDTVPAEIEKISHSGQAIRISQAMGNRLPYHLQYIAAIDFSILSTANRRVYMGAYEQENMTSVTSVDYAASRSGIVTGHDDGSVAEWRYERTGKRAQLVGAPQRVPGKVLWVSHLDDSGILAATHQALYVLYPGKRPELLLDFEEVGTPMAFDYSTEDGLLFIGLRNSNLLLYALDNRGLGGISVRQLRKVDYKKEDETQLADGSKAYSPIILITYHASLKTVAFATASGRLIIYQIAPKGEVLTHYQVAGIKYQEKIKDIVIDEEGTVLVALRNKIIKWPLSQDALCKGLNGYVTQKSISVK